MPVPTITLPCPQSLGLSGMYCIKGTPIVIDLEAACLPLYIVHSESQKRLMWIREHFNLEGVNIYTKIF